MSILVKMLTVVIVNFLITNTEVQTTYNNDVTYDMSYLERIGKLYTKPLEGASKNSRTVFWRAEWKIGNIKYFSNNATSYCKEIKRL